MRVLSWQEAVRILERNGFVFVRQRGSHMRYRGVVNGEVRRVSVPRHRELRIGTLHRIKEQSGLPQDLFE